MTTSENGIALLKSHEGFVAHVYDDNGHDAIGYGHDLLPGESFPDGITQADADQLLREDLARRYEPFLNEWLTEHNQIATQNQFDALIDFAYNLGPGALGMMLGHGWDQVPVQIIRWNKVNSQPNAGLTARRQAELNLWEKA